ncbi:hypothetical protein LTR57_018560 [Friedmanniomyces endolithicus]|nr:hypothetical protein LTR57_018560 [Friedmanniomyces endolithicus]
MSTTLSYASSLTATRSFGTGLRGTPSRFTRGNATVTNHTTTTLSHPSGATRQQPTITVGSQTESRQPPLSPDVTFRSKASRFTARKVLPASILSETTRSAFTTPSGPVTPPNPKAGHGATNQPTCTSDVTTDQASILQRLESAGIQIPEFADTTEMAMFCADARRKVECAEKVAEEQARFGQMIAEIMEESRQRYLVAEALGLRPAHDPPLERDPRFAEAWNEVVIARRQRDARTASMRDLESASSAVPSQMQSRLPETSKHDQVGLEAEVHTEATIHLDASEKDTMYGSEPSSVPFTYEQPRMGKRRIDMMTAGRHMIRLELSGWGLRAPCGDRWPRVCMICGIPQSLLANVQLNSIPQKLSWQRRRLGRLLSNRRQNLSRSIPPLLHGGDGARGPDRSIGSKEVSCLSALPSIRDARVSLTGVSNAAAAAWETPVMPQQTSIEDLIAKYRSQPRAFKRARPLARLQPIESATIIDAPAYRSEPPASAPAPVAEDAAAGDVDDAIIVDHTEWDRRFEIAEARRQERQPQAEPGLEPEPEAEDAPGILSKLSSWARSAMAWVKEKVWG